MTAGRRTRAGRSDGLPRNSPPRWPKLLPRGSELWTPAKTKWTEDNTDGLFVCDFIEATIRLTKGARRGELVELRHWQGDVICDVLRLAADGRRAYRAYELFIARKNSKSLLGAGLALDGLFDEPGAEVYSCAGDKDQAKLVFREVVEAVAMSPELGGPSGKSGLLKVYRDAIEYPELGSVYRALSSESRLKEGMNPSRVLFDEKHAQRNDELWNVMNQGSGTRDAPLVMTMTTKGLKTYTDGTDTVCYRGYEYAKKVMAGELEDRTYGSRIYETNLRPGEDYRDPKTWPAANPALGDFLSIEDMDSKCRQLPEADFKTKRLNIWVTTSTAWLPDGAWGRLARKSRKRIPGEIAVLAFDGAFSNDSTALVAWLLGGEQPHLTLVGLWERPDKAASDWHVPVAEVEQLIVATYRGQTIDVVSGPAAGRHIQQLPDIAVREVVFDPARWLGTFKVLEEQGLPIVEYPNTADRMVPATQSFFTAVLNKEFTHDGHPALARHAANAVTKMTSRGVMVSKAGARRKVDALVAAIFGRDRAVTEPDDESGPNLW